MRTKEVSNQEDLGQAISEMRESATSLLSSVGNLAKQVNWKSAAPKIIIALVILYGVKNHKLIRSLVASMAVGKIGDEMMSRMEKANA